VSGDINCQQQQKMIEIALRLLSIFYFLLVLLGELLDLCYKFSLYWSSTQSCQHCWIASDIKTSLFLQYFIKQKQEMLLLQQNFKILHTNLCVIMVFRTDVKIGLPASTWGGGDFFLFKIKIYSSLKSYIAI
jgi:hypothetical protein